MAKTASKKVKIDAAVKDLMEKAMKQPREQYTLPKFELQVLINLIQDLVDKAPGGIVQLVIDLFCGAGGTSEGIERATYFDKKNSCIIAGINHDKKAIYSQSKNHKYAYYTDEDIRFANLTPIIDLINTLRKLFPQCPIIIWASLECTNHSNAKGGLARDPDSRTLPWDLYRYIEAIKPEGIWIENVKEFTEWGPMMERVVLAKGKTKKSMRSPIPRHLEDAFFAEKIEKGFICSCSLEMIKVKKKIVGFRPEWVPIKDLKGTYYLPWKDTVDAYGYHNQERILNAADYGAPTNRRRLFLIFMLNGWPITFPHPTHAKSPKKGDMFDPGLKKHVAVRTCLDFSIEGRSVFDEGHVESEKTWDRVYEGLIKFVAGGKEAFMTQRNGGTALSRIYGVDDPARTVTTTGGNQELVQAFLFKNNSSHNNTQVNKGSSVDEPAPTITAMPTVGLIQPFMIKYMGNNAKTGSNPGLSIDNPANTITAQPRLGLIQPYFIARYNNNSDGTVNKGSSIDEPAPTIMTVPALALVKADFIMNYYSNGGGTASLDKASPTVTTKDRMALVSPKFILNYQGQSHSNSVEEPAPTLMTKEKLALMNIKYFMYRAYSAGGRTGSVDQPEGSVVTNPKTALMEVQGWIMDTHYENVGTGLEEPGSTITANRKWSYLMNPSWFGSVGSTDDPAVTIIARQDKAPIYLLSVSESKYSLAVPVFDDDPEIVVKIKEFMAIYNIYDIKKRMLLVPELLQIQSFPVDYYLAGSKTDQKKFIGNAVPPVVARAIAESMYLPIVEHICKIRNIQLNQAA